MFTDSIDIFLYLAIVGIVGLVVLLWSRNRIQLLRKLREKRTRKLDIDEPIETASPINQSRQQHQEEALQSVKKRFSIIQKLTGGSIILIWFFFLGLPFLDKVPTAIISTLLAAIGIIIGVAARPIIENFIAGIILTYSRLINTGDTVIIDQHYGTVEDITLTHAVIKIWNWRRYLIPNSKMLSKEVINITLNDAYQWAHVTFTVAYNSDLQLVKKLAIESAEQASSFEKEEHETPGFWVMDMQPQGIECWLAAWTDSPAQAWELRHEMRTNLMSQLQKHGIMAQQMHIDLGATMPGAGHHNVS